LGVDQGTLGCAAASEGSLATGPLGTPGWYEFLDFRVLEISESGNEVGDSESEIAKRVYVD
jgi:hypothetical protein